MKFKKGIYVTLLGIALSIGAITFSSSSKSSSQVQAAADYSNYFSKPICEIVVGSDYQTSITGVAADHKITDPSYAYIVRMPDGSSSINNFVSIEYTGSSSQATFDLCFVNIYARSGNWAPIFNISNKAEGSKINVNLYAEGENNILSHNWNAIVCRDGQATVRFSTITGGSFHFQDTYGGSWFADERSFLTLEVDENVLVNSCTLGAGPTSSVNASLSAVFLSDSKITNFSIELSRHIHRFSSFSFDWLHDLNGMPSSCIGTAHCLDCGYEKTENGTVISSTIEATCENNAEVRYVATFSDGSTSQTSYQYPDSALGHVPSENWFNDDERHWRVCETDRNHVLNEDYHTYSEPSYEINSDYTSCEMTRVCSVCGYVSTMVTDCVPEIIQAPTCEEKGQLSYNFYFIGDYGISGVVDIDPVGHSPSSDWVSDDEYHWHSCYNDDHEKLNLSEHILEDPVFSPSEDLLTCTMTRTCSVCGRQIFSTVEGDSTILVNPTCTEPGEILYRYVFGTEFAHEERDVLSPLGHNATVEYYHDEFTHWHGCGNDSTHRLDEEHHNFGNINYAWSSDGKSSCTASKTCATCGFVYSEDGVITSNVKVAPTCLNKGTTTYTATFGSLGQSTFDVVDIDAKGHNASSNWTYDENTHWHDCSNDENEKLDETAHNYGAATYTWATDGSSCNASKTCETCGYVLTENAQVSSSVKINPTCAENGTTLYAARFSNFDVNTKEISNIPALGHDVNLNWETSSSQHWHICNHNGCIEHFNVGDHEYVSNIDKMPTTEEEGLKTYTCSVCGYSYSETLDKLPTPPNKEEMTEEEYEEQQKEYEKQQEAAVEQMTEAINDIIAIPEPTTEEEVKQAEKIAEALAVISEVNTTDTSSEVATVSQEAKQKAQENVVNITNTVSSELNSLSEEQKALEDVLNNPNASLEEKAAAEQQIAQIEEKKEIVQIVTTQAILVTAKQTESEEKGSVINDAIPADVGIDMGSVYNEFMQNQIDDLLGNRTAPILQVMQAIRPNFDNVAESSNGSIDYSTSKDVYKQVEVFVDDSVEKLQNAALKLRQCSGEQTSQEIKNYITKVTISSFRDFDKEAADEEFAITCYYAILNQMQSEVIASLEENKPDGTNQAALDQYNEEMAAVVDIEEFEIIVTEVLRRNYLALTGNDVDLDSFHDEIYWPIFRAWALNIDVPEEIFPDGKVISLQELTTATVEETTVKGTNFKFEVVATKGDVIFLVVMAGIAVFVIAGAAILPRVINKRKED